MLTVQYAKALPDIKFNAVEPGFTAPTSLHLAGWTAGGERRRSHRADGDHRKGRPSGTFQEGRMNSPGSASPQGAERAIGDTMHLPVRPK